MNLLLLAFGLVHFVPVQSQVNGKYRYKLHAVDFN